jgi:Protein of unknown function (DUF3160)/FlgD Ig-like domain
MKKSCISSLPLLFGLFLGIGYAQQGQQFSIDAYTSFLNSSKNLTPQELYSLHPAGLFRSGVPMAISGAVYVDSVSIKYQLTDGEKSLLAKNGFVVTERLSYGSFGEALGDIYHKDLPVFVSTDAILHTIHMSYDDILMTVEKQILIQKLDTLLGLLHDKLPALAAKYSTRPAMTQMINDVDVYLTVPRVLLGSITAPKFSTNIAVVDTLLGYIAGETQVSYPIFSSTGRNIDFSQFTTRGHYTQSVELGRYFKAMMWLGKIEVYLIAPVSSDPPPSDADIQRQTIDAVLVRELADTSNAFPILDGIDGLIKFFVGESDNVTLSNVGTIANEIGLKDASELLDTLRWHEFQDTLSSKPFAFQRILSQILYSNPFDMEKVKPASAFLLLGQRFIIDSYVTGNVVYDKVPTMRMLPSPLDVLFATGNDAAAQLLKDELEEYQYSPNLAALRYLIDSYGDDFWTVSIYNAWLESIRSLNPPADRSSLPLFMQTAAWWQEKMNTQLASWAQLRHDNLLYAKQSYTPGVICSYPEGYVEPIPEFYKAVKAYAEMAESKFQQPPLNTLAAGYYFSHLKGVADTLETIARKELSGTSLSDMEKGFLQRMLFDAPMCGLVYDGWYPGLFYGTKGVLDSDMVVADIHTAPTDDGGDLIGWVLHVGTGPINMAVVVTLLPGGNLTAFVGPVMSYYEHLSTGFKRLTDEEWKTAYALSPSLRPSFVNAYLATTDGTARPAGASLLTAVNEPPPAGSIPNTIQLSQNYPNPFNSTTMIAFTIPRALSHSRAEIVVYNINGQVVKRILSSDLEAGNYTVRWDAKDDRGNPVASGVYFYRLNVGTSAASGKLILLK